MQLFRQGHNQVSTVFSKGFYNSIQCRSGKYVIFRSGTIGKSVRVVDEKQDISLLWP